MNSDPPLAPSQSPPRPSRRAVLGGSLALGALGAFALAGCGTAGQSRIRYWNLFGGGDGVLMVKMQDEFRAKYPNISLEAVTLAWGAPYYTKLAMAAAGGRGPEVAIMHLARLPGFAPASLLDPFDEKLLAEVGVTKDQFPPALIERASVNGKLYALPLDTHPLVMYYNTDIAGKAGLLGSDGKLTPLTSEDQFIDALKKLKGVTGVTGLAVDNGDVQPWRIFWSLYRQQDGTIELPIGGSVRMDDAKAIKALTFMRRLTSEGLATVGIDYPGAVATFTEKRAGIHWNGDWEVATFTTAKLPFSMTGFPALYGNGRAEADSHSFVLPHQRDRDPEVTRAAYIFMAYLLKNSVTWGQAGHIPAYQPVTTSPQYLALKPQSEYRDVINDVQLDPPAWFSGSGSELENQAGVAFQAVFTGALTPEAALAQFKGALNRLLTTPSPA